MSSPVAIVGLAHRFPSTKGGRGFWDDLLLGMDCLRPTPEARWYFRVAPSDVHVAPQPGSYLEDIDRFDADFFRINGREAAWMDPQHRIMLELTWACLEDAAHPPSSLAHDRVGVYVGVSSQDYRELVHQSGRPLEGYSSLGSTASMLTSRISYVFGFRGPSLSIDTACSSSLVALHHAVRDIRYGECDQALVGGVNLNLTPSVGQSLGKAGMLSPRGRCRTFDASADGYVRGEGAAMMLLKPLARARADGDRIYGVVYGTAMNHGGMAPTVTSPNVFSQAAVIARAYRDADVSPDRVSYVEAHGTGTPLGDPIEVAGLKRAFRTLARERGVELTPGSIRLGSVKTHLGHLEGAAGIAGVVNILLCMENETLVGLEGFEVPNPHLRIDGSPFSLLERPTPWPGKDRIASVSSFGFGGVNTHVVLGDAPASEGAEPVAERAPEGGHCLVLSAADDAALRAYARRMIAALTAFTVRRVGPSPRGPGGLASLIHTLQVGREPLAERLAAPVDTIDDVVTVLSGWLAGEASPNVFHGRVDAPSGEPGPGAADAAEIWCRRWVEGATVDWSLLRRGDPPRRMGLPTYPFGGRRHWVCEPPLPAHNPVEALPERVAEVEDLYLHYVAQEEEQRAIIVSGLHRALQGLGMAEPLAARQVGPALGVLPKYAPLLDAILDMVRSAGHLLEEGDEVCLVGSPPEAPPPRDTPPNRLLRTCLDHLVPVLRGEIPPTSVLFPDGSMELVEPVYRGNPIADFFNDRAAEAVERAVAHRLDGSSGDARVRILEIGAGTGGTTAGVVQRLMPHGDRIEYVYSDISLGFRAHAERLRERAPFVSWEILDVEKDPASREGGPLDAFDVVIASNVLHATRDIRRTLKHVGMLMKHGGSLVLNEINTFSPFTSLTFGLLDGWWRFQDPELRIPNSPCLTFDAWRQVLQERQFQAVCSVAGQGSERLGQQVLTSVSVGATAHAPTTRRSAPPKPPTAAVVAGTELEAGLLAVVAEALGLDPDRVSVETTLYELGVDSLVALELRNLLEGRFGVRVPMTARLEELTIRQAAARLGDMIAAGGEQAPEVATVDEGEDGYV